MLLRLETNSLEANIFPTAPPRGWDVGLSDLTDDYDSLYDTDEDVLNAPLHSLYHHHHHHHHHHLGTPWTLPTPSKPPTPPPNPRPGPIPPRPGAPTPPDTP
ncbi:hypothetical protein VTH82DRAFT_2450 [Thermothelomyces myriococcoides]